MVYYSLFIQIVHFSFICFDVIHQCTNKNKSYAIVAEKSAYKNEIIVVWVELWNIIVDKQCAFDTTGDVLFAKILKLVMFLLVIHLTLSLLFPSFIASSLKCGQMNEISARVNNNMNASQRNSIRKLMVGKSKKKCEVFFKAHYEHGHKKWCSFFSCANTYNIIYNMYNFSI